jgi:HAMP domain-containing protein
MPLKLFGTYLLVLGIVSVPMFLYIRERLDIDVRHNAESRLQAIAQRFAVACNAATSAETTAAARHSTLVAFVTQHQRFFLDRVTLIAHDGEVLFDSTTAHLPNHADRAEFQAARHGEVMDVAAVATRTSATTGTETVYAAIRLNQEGDVLRLSRPADELSGATRALKKLQRNVSALAISLALLFSALAAFFYARPLRAIHKATQQFATGDLLTRVGHHGDDEFGQVAHALNDMAQALRRQLANAGSADAVVAQLIDALPHPSVVMELLPTSARMLATNPAARRSVFANVDAATRVQAWSQSEAFQRAIVAAEKDGDPERLTFDVDGKPFVASIHLLKRPGAAPLVFLRGEQRAPTVTTSIPPSREIRLASLQQLVQEGTARAKRTWRFAQSVDVTVPDINGRVVDAVHDLAIAMGDVDMTVVVEGTEVRCRMDVAVEDHVVRRVGERIHLIGGRVESHARETLLWLPLA